MTRGLILLMACACGIAVANVYYAQPLLEQIRETFDTSASAASVVSMLTQVGYALGLLLIVPLGDVRHRRHLIVSLLIVEALCLASAAISQSLLWLQISSLGIGIATVTPQLIVPLVAQISEPEKRGKNVGTVMSGLLLGILLARVVSGFVGGQWGWRVMFWVACALALGLAAVLSRTLPDVPSTAQLRFSDLMRSIWNLAQEEPRLRESAYVGALSFGAFMVFWNSLAFHLEGPPFHYTPQIVGLFGLVGAAGALVAPIAGSQADARGSRAVINVSVLATAISFGLFWWFGYQVIGLIVGVLLMDAGVQGTQIANQARIFALRPEARSRVNTVYMVTYFVGGSLGSLFSALAWGRAGWSGVCATGLAFALCAVLVHLAYAPAAKRELAQAVSTDS